MAYPVSLAQLRTRALQKADVDASVLDVGGNGWLSKTEVDDLVVESAARFYDISLDIVGPEVFSKETYVDFGPNIQPPPVRLPDDFYRLVSVHICDQSANPYGPKPFANFVPMEPVVEQGGMMTELLNTEPCDGPFFYQIRKVRDPSQPDLSERLEVWPYPTRDRFVHIRYVPVLDRNNAEGDATRYDGIAGWDQWVVLDVAIAILQKEESDTGALERERDRVESRMRSKSGKTNSHRARVPIDMIAATSGVRDPRWPR